MPIYQTVEVELLNLKQCCVWCMYMGSVDLYPLLSLITKDRGSMRLPHWTLRSIAVQLKITEIRNYVYLNSIYSFYNVYYISRKQAKQPFHPRPDLNVYRCVIAVHHSFQKGSSNVPEAFKAPQASLLINHCQVKPCR